MNEVLQYIALLTLHFHVFLVHSSLAVNVYYFLLRITSHPRDVRVSEVLG